MVVAEKEESLDDFLLDGQKIDSPSPENSLIWLRQKTISYDRPDGMALLLTYDIYHYSSDRGKEIYKLKYQSGLILPF